MISSSDARWGAVNRNIIENKLKSIIPKITLSTSDSKEDLDKSKSFLKGGATTELWNDTNNYMKLEERAKNIDIGIKMLLKPQGKYQ